MFLQGQQDLKCAAISAATAATRGGTAKAARLHQQDGFHIPWMLESPKQVVVADKVFKGNNWGWLYSVTGN